MKTALLTWISGKDFCQMPELKIFLKTVKEHFSGEVIVFTTEISNEIRNEFRVVDVKEPVPWIIRDRFIHYWNFLNENPNYDLVFQTDAKDVLFQNDPVKWVLEDAKVYHKMILNGDFPYICFVPEGMIHLVSMWNMIEQYKIQKTMPSYGESWQNWAVLNGGVFFGTLDVFKDFCFLLWSNCYRSTCNEATSTDQSYLNYLYHKFLKKDSRYKMLPMQTNTFCLTGEAVAREFLFPPAEFRDGKFYHVNGRMFSVVHQWERTRFRDEVLKFYE